MMKIQSVFLYLILISITGSVLAQDHFVIVKQNDEMSFRYPPNVVMTLYDDQGTKTQIKKNDAITVEGNYVLEIDVPWSENNDIIESDGGVLEIFVLPIESRKAEHINVLNLKPTQKDSANTGLKPRLERKELSESKMRDDKYNLLLVFENGVVFKYEDGQVRAWQDGNEINVTNKYLVQTSTGLLKVSFDPSDGETWWVWDL